MNKRMGWDKGSGVRHIGKKGVEKVRRIACAHVCGSVPTATVPTTSARSEGNTIGIHL